MNVPVGMLTKVVVQMGFGEYIASQMEHYSYDYQQGAFAVGGPTDVVRRITGREAEDYETIVRRYAAAMPDVKPSLSAKLKLFAIMNLAMLRPKPKSGVHLATRYFSDPQHISLSAQSPEWHTAHGAQDDAAGQRSPLPGDEQVPNRQPLKAA